jgi:hypothetical protein
MNCLFITGGQESELSELVGGYDLQSSPPNPPNRAQRAQPPFPDRRYIGGLLIAYTPPVSHTRKIAWHPFFDMWSLFFQ